MKILITGGTGFVGKRLINFLISKKYKFKVITRNKRIKLKNFIYLDKNFSNASKKILKFNPSIIIHLATNFQKEHNFKKIPMIIDGNITFGAKIIELLQHKIKLFINTNSAYTSINGTNYDPKDFYGSTKYAFEAILKYYNKYNNFKVINLLIADTYGPKDSRSKLINTLLNSDKKITINNPYNEINYTYIDDLINAFNLIINKKWEKKWNNFSIFSNKNIKIYKLIHLIETAKKKKIKIIYKKKFRNKNFFKFKPRYKRLIGWKNKVSIDEGITRCLET